MQAPGLVVVGGLILTAVGIGSVAPVGQGPTELAEAQRAGVSDEHLLVTRKDLGTLRRACPGEHARVGLGDVTGSPRRLHGGHRPQLSAQPHASAGGRTRQVAAGGDRRRRRAGSVDLPRPRGVEGRCRSSRRRLEARQLTMEEGDGVTVGHKRRVRLGKDVEGGCQGLGCALHVSHRFLRAREPTEGEATP